jgi:hypothetical protein
MKPIDNILRSDRGFQRTLDFCLPKMKEPTFQSAIYCGNFGFPLRQKLLLSEQSLVQDAGKNICIS